MPIGTCISLTAIWMCGSRPATWRWKPGANIKALHDAGKAGWRSGEGGQAREQYFRFQEDVQNALAGRPGEATHTANGTTAGVFRALPGVQVAERRLRMLLGVPISDGELLRPTDQPSLAPVHFDWSRSRLTPWRGGPNCAGSDG